MQIHQNLHFVLSAAAQLCQGYMIQKYRIYANNGQNKPRYWDVLNELLWLNQKYSHQVALCQHHHLLVFESFSSAFNIRAASGPTGIPREVQLQPPQALQTSAVFAHKDRDWLPL